MSKVTDYIEEMSKDPQQPGPFFTDQESREWADEHWNIWHAKHPPEVEKVLLEEHGARYRPKINWNTNSRGNLVIRRHLSAERYKWDFDEDFRNAGWEQFDTDQDAWYFGVWVNKKQFRTFSYVEGDLILVICPDAAHYNAEIADACKFYGEGFEFIACDTVAGFEHVMLGNPDGAKDVTVCRQNRQRFFAEVA